MCTVDKNQAGSFPAFISSQFMNPQIPIEVGAALISVASYHPFRTIGVHLAKGLKVSLNPRLLYRGFWYSALCSHQIPSMSLSKDFFAHDISKRKSTSSPYFVQIISCIFAGAVSSISVTPCEVLTLQKQLNNKDFKSTLKNLYQGISFTALRQIQLCLFMIYFPQFMSESTAKYPAINENKKISKILFSTCGGVLAAVSSQIFELARISKQSNLNNQSLNHWKIAQKQLFATESRGLFMARIVVIVIATVVSNTTREKFNRILQGEF